ncbi:MAG: HAMP domain-containing histidine kinase [Candidatus Dormibacteraeota bacterium]|nr:HAMP domain-containing histidine kinase [Candidatus Dormibacteraeota bacterium]
MTTQFSDFLAAHAGRIAELWRRQPEGEHGALEHGPRELVSAVLLALTADDLRPLVALYRLESPAGVEERLDGALRDLQRLIAAADAAAKEQHVDPESGRALAIEAADELGVIARRLTGTCVAALRTQLATATSTSAASSSSLSITMHELRRPLTILSSYVQLLGTGMLGSLPESAAVALEGITASTEMMVRLVSAIAELARLEDPDDRLTFDDLDAAELVAAALEQVAMEAQLRGTKIETTAPHRLRIRGDRRRLVLALTNLLGNAIKHGPAESTIEVTVRVEDGCARFAVRDHGAGFPEEDTPHLFDKYFRSVAERKRKVPGSGLGLYIVRTVSERHGGSVAARTIEGNGAEFEMILPVHDTE